MGRLREQLVRLGRNQPEYYIASKKDIDTPLRLVIDRTDTILDRKFPVTRPSWSPAGPGLGKVLSHLTIECLRTHHS